MHFKLRQFTDYSRGTLADAAIFNQRLMAALERALSHPARQSHFFDGRFENIYFGPDQLPELAPLLTALHQAAQTICQQKLREVSNHYWLNQMAPDQRTSLHTHDEGDERLSAVYYLKVPPHSGDLILHTPRQNSSGQKIIRPKAGEAIFFDPALPHEVTRNNSAQTRLSLALNFGAG